ncbi:MAG: HD domain-containing protein [Spirochaetaceae bacterium]|jgi:HD superfamily phosphohydrolase|nr:HD domain-containing protein [Spirochaetaceae bacterium]
MNDAAYSALERGFTAPIRDPLWGHIYLTPELEALAKSPPFMRLHRILQLGSAYCVYPGATHTRAAHALGVYELARRLAQRLAKQDADQWLTPKGIRSFLAASLLHDLGHFPYAHSLKELPLADHEALTAQIILAEPAKTLIAKAGGDPYFAGAIIDTNLPDNGDAELRFYRKLLSGVLDPDKLDYLNRDARYCGVPYGAQDADFIFSRVHPHPERGIDIDARAIPCVESALFSKYLMYRTVYWHPGVRSATGMIKKLLLNALENRIIAPEELYDQDDAGLFALLAGRNAPFLELANKVRNGRLYFTALELPYTETLHPDLQDIAKRSHYEKALARIFGGSVAPEEVILDIPEPVAFETSLYVTDEACYFEQSSGVIKAETVHGFIKSLHRTRIFVDPAHKTRYNPEKCRSKVLDLLHTRIVE